jgi:SAM-dependent methyltransferase
MKNIVRRETCRLCESTNLSLAFSLTPTPLANNLENSESTIKPQDIYPLDIFFCNGCSHVQLLDVVNPKLLFENYYYVSGTSSVFVKHFEEYFLYIKSRFSPSKSGLVVDIGSNDGTLLKFFKDDGYTVLGIDPAQNLSTYSKNSGIDTIVDFFSHSVANEILAKYGKASVITANNVFAHIDDLRSCVEAAKNLLADEGVLVFEVSSLVDVFEKKLFDTIYHEHLDYHSVKPLVIFLDSCGLKLVEVERVMSHGGSIRVSAQLKSNSRKQGESVREALLLESELGLDRIETIRDFYCQIDLVKYELYRLLVGLKEKGKSIVGFGAPAKMTTLLYHLGINKDLLDFIVDDSPLKQGRFTPGLHIPILDSRALYEKKPDYVLILAWNFSDSIVKNHSAYSNSGGKFIIPLPSIEII